MSLFLNIILIGERGLGAFVLMTRGNINSSIVSFCEVDLMLKNIATQFLKNDTIP